MTINFMTHGASLLDEDDVLPVLRVWRRQGLKTALVTLIGVEGGAPRQAGAQMAVAEDGRYAGYLSGGCLEQAVALEAKAVIEAGVNRKVRYGKGSPYFDIRLPCGSGLDLYFDQALSDDALDAVLDHRKRRRPVALTTRMADGTSSVALQHGPLPLSAMDGDVFKRIYPAAIRLALIGNGPAISGIAALAKVAGFEPVVWTTDETTRVQLQATGIDTTSGEMDLADVASSLDEASAAVVVFHDHDAEPAILQKLLATPAFYIGVLGNRAVHRARCDALSRMGIDAAQIARLHAPVGSIPNAKSKTTFAFGVLTELLAIARAQNLVA